MANANGSQTSINRNANWSRFNGETSIGSIYIAMNEGTTAMCNSTRNRSGIRHSIRLVTPEADEAAYQVPDMATLREITSKISDQQIGARTDTPPAQSPNIDKPLPPVPDKPLPPVPVSRSSSTLNIISHPPRAPDPTPSPSPCPSYYADDDPGSHTHPANPPGRTSFRSRLKKLVAIGPKLVKFRQVLERAKGSLRGRGGKQSSPAAPTPPAQSPSNEHLLNAVPTPTSRSRSVTPQDSTTAQQRWGARESRDLDNAIRASMLLVQQRGLPYDEDSQEEFREQARRLGSSLDAFHEQMNAARRAREVKLAEIRAESEEELRRRNAVGGGVQQGPGLEVLPEERVGDLRGGYRRNASEESRWGHSDATTVLGFSDPRELHGWVGPLQ